MSLAYGIEDETLLFRHRSVSRVLHARLYPDNDTATQTGMVSGTVTNMMTGKGRFQLNYKGEVLTGEATRVFAVTVTDPVPPSGRCNVVGVTVNISTGAWLPSGPTTSNSSTSSVAAPRL